MTETKYVYGKYFQKSFNYLYPLLGMSRDLLFRPAGSYLRWNGGDSIENYKLVVTYEEEDPLLFEPFEKKHIFKNPYFESCYSVEGGKVYVFDLSSFKETVKKFRQGKYSDFSESVKKKILIYHEASTDKIPRPGRLVHMSLYPELYFEEVGAELGTKAEYLQEVGELIDPPNDSRESLSIKIIGKCEETS